MVHVSRLTFYDSFRAVTHLSPLHWAKSAKLDRADTLIKEGKKACKAGYLVGYIILAQFSQEYKRHFACAPSET